MFAKSSGIKSGCIFKSKEALLNSRGSGKLAVFRNRIRKFLASRICIIIICTDPTPDPPINNQMYSEKPCFFQYSDF
jgi:hypothetical protein